MAGTHRSFRPFTILHLTDLHLTAPDAAKGHFWNSEAADATIAPRDRRGMLGICEDLEAQALRPDLVIVTGDFLDKGAESGIALAVRFLELLALRLLLPRNRFVLVPGNHDVARDGEPSTRYAAFDRIRSEFYGDQRPSFSAGAQPHERVERFDFDEDLGVEVLAFNSCEDLDEAAQKAHGSIGLSQREAADALLEASKSKGLFRIAALHHHLVTPDGVTWPDYSLIDDSGLVRGWLVQHRFQLALNGHQHVDGQHIELREEWHLAVVTGGSMGVGSYARGAWNLPLSYHVIVVDTPDRGRRIRREYDPQLRKWIAGTRTPAVQVLAFGGLDPDPALATPSVTAPPVAPASWKRPSRFVGREVQLTSLLAMILQPETPPVAVLGPAGIGKSTLVLQALERPEVRLRYKERKWFVRLDATRKAAAAEKIIAAKLRLAHGSDLEEEIRTELSREQSLLVLDNLETLWDRDREGTEDLLANLALIPGLQLVVALRGSVLPSGVAWRGTVQVDSLDEATSRALFCAIALLAKPDSLPESEDSALRSLLAKVDGVPLAITLLAEAAQGNTLSNLLSEWTTRQTAVLERLGQSNPDRDSSWAVSLELSMGSRQLKQEARRLALVLAQLPDGIARSDLLAMFAEMGPYAARMLSSVGLAFFEHERVRMLAPIREHLARLTALVLAVSDTSAAPARAAWQAEIASSYASDCQRALDHYGVMAETHGPFVGFRGHDSALARLAPEAGNVDAMLRLGLASGARIWAERTLALTRFARYSDRSLPLERALVIARAIGAPKLEAGCLRALGDAAHRSDRLEDAEQRFHEALSLCQRQDDLRGTAECRRKLGDLALRRSQSDEASLQYEAALAFFGACGDRLGEAACLLGLANLVDLADASPGAALADYEQALERFQTAGDLRNEANCLLALAELAVRERAPEPEARNRFTSALSLYQQIADATCEASCLLGLGALAQRHEQPDDSRRSFEAARRIYRQLGDVLREARTGESLAQLAVACSDRGEAVARYAEAQEAYRRARSITGEAACGEKRGDLALELAALGEARLRYEDALDLYAQISDFDSTGRLDLKLAKVTTGAERAGHLESSRIAWKSLGKPELLALIDAEIGAAG